MTNRMYDGHTDDLALDFEWNGIPFSFITKGKLSVLLYCASFLTKKKQNIFLRVQDDLESITFDLHNKHKKCA